MFPRQLPAPCVILANNGLLALSAICLLQKVFILIMKFFLLFNIFNYPQCAWVAKTTEICSLPTKNPPAEDNRMNQPCSHFHFNIFDVTLPEDRVAKGSLFGRVTSPSEGGMVSQQRSYEWSTGKKETKGTLIMLIAKHKWSWLHCWRKHQCTCKETQLYFVWWADEHYTTH